MDKRLTSHHNPRTQNQSFVGSSPATQLVRERIQQAVDANIDTILLTGETGTGKEVVAREIHFQGTSEGAPFVALNCSALPESLVESELFGHVKGAFTDATTDKPGYFEIANNGTLFLDEIAELPLHLQAKLLRVLDTRSLRRIGSTQEIAFQERIISAFNNDPVSLVKSGKFRSDLYYRLNVFPIHLTPLRERPKDILPLAYYFLAACAIESRRTFSGFSEAAQATLLNYQYPGNVRELQNIVQRTAALCPPAVSLICTEHLDIRAEALEEIPSQSDESAVKNEHNQIVHALEEARWNRSQAAKNLGIPYSTLRYKMEKFGIS